VKTSCSNGLRTTAAALALLWSLTPGAARAASLITNGGFESGFTGWTRDNQTGGDGNFFAQSGTTSPVTGTTVPAPPGGSTAAMTDAEGSGAHVLYQDFSFVVPANEVGATLSFSLFIGNRADRFVVPATLNFATTALNQQARVDIITTTANVFSVAAADVVFNAFQTRVGDPLVSGYSTFTLDVSSLLSSRRGQTLRLRFAETDNVNLFQFGVDNVSLLTAVPEPSGVVMLGMGLLGTSLLGLLRRRRNRRSVSA